MVFNLADAELFVEAYDKTKKQHYIVIKIYLKTYKVFREFQ